MSLPQGSPILHALYLLLLVDILRDVLGLRYAAEGAPMVPWLLERCGWGWRLACMLHICPSRSLWHVHRKRRLPGEDPTTIAFK